MSDMYIYRPGDRIKEDARYIIKYGPKEYRVANYGHVGFIGGEAGAMKSTFVKTICAAALARTQVLFNKVDVDDKKVVYFDTEMPKDLFVGHLENMFDTAFIAPEEVQDRFIGASLVSQPDPTKKKKLILDTLNDLGSDTGIAVIDVIADLFDDENDTETAQKFVGEIAAMAADFDSMYFIVSHISDAGKLLGSIGRKVHRKSSFGMNLQKVSSKVSYVKPDKTRYEQYPPFEFRLNEHGLPEPGEYIPFPIITK